MGWNPLPFRHDRQIKSCSLCGRLSQADKLKWRIRPRGRCDLRPWVVESVNTRLLTLGGMMLVLLAGMALGGGLADGPGITRKHHPWGRFAPGAWKLVRVDTYEGDAKAVTSSTETKTTLQSLAADGVSLMIEVAVEVGGKQFETQPQVVKQGFDGELCTPGAVIKDLGPGQVTVQGRKIDCRVEQVAVEDACSRTADQDLSLRRG